MSDDEKQQYFVPAPPVAFKADDKDRTTWDDLLAVGISRDDVMKMFYDRFGEKPKAVYLNKGICIEFGYLCNNYQGNVSYNSQETKPITRVAASKTISNNSNHDIDVTIELKTSETKSASVTVTQSSSVSFGSKITVGSKELGIGGEFSMQFAIENSVGSTDSTSKTVEFSESVVAHLKPHSGVKADLVTNWKKLAEEFSIPISISGWVGADFGHRVNGHFYWFYRLPNNLSGTLRGTVDAAYDIGGDIEIHDV